MSMARAQTRSWLAVSWLSALGLILVAVLLPRAAVAQPGDRNLVDLRPKFVVGQQTRFVMEVTNTSTPVGAATKPTTVRPRPGTDPRTPAGQTKSKIEFGLLMKVKEGGGTDGATVDVVFERIKVSTTGEDGTVEFDSTKPQQGEGDLVGILMGQLVGTTLTMKVDPSGNITSISGGESFSMLGQFMGGGGGAGSLFGPIVNMKKGGGKVAVGESWENEDVVNTGLMGGFKMVTRHTLRSAVGGDAKVDMTGRMVASSEAGSGTVAQLKNSKYTGSYVWDTKGGMLKQMDSSMSVEMETSVEDRPVLTRNESTMKVRRGN